MGFGEMGFGNMGHTPIVVIRESGLTIIELELERKGVVSRSISGFPVRVYVR